MAVAVVREVTALEALSFCHQIEAMGIAMRMEMCCA